MASIGQHSSRSRCFRYRTGRCKMKLCFWWNIWKMSWVVTSHHQVTGQLIIKSFMELKHLPGHKKTMLVGLPPWPCRPVAKQPWFPPRCSCLGSPEQIFRRHHQVFQVPSSPGSRPQRDTKDWDGPLAWSPVTCRRRYATVTAKPNGQIVRRSQHEMLKNVQKKKKKVSYPKRF